MRGLRATLTAQRGLAGHMIAATVGHEDVRTTMTAYARPRVLPRPAQCACILALPSKNRTEVGAWFETRTIRNLVHSRDDHQPDHGSAC